MYFLTMKNTIQKKLGWHHTIVWIFKISLFVNPQGRKMDRETTRHSTYT